MVDRNPLPKTVNAVGDRIGLKYNINRKETTRKYIDDTQESTRMAFDQLKNTYYSLTESRTKKDLKPLKAPIKRLVKNSLKLSARVRKTLYRLKDEEKQKLRYSIFEKIHDLWQQYSAIVSNESDPMSMFRMDLHGCKLKCIASKNPTFVGFEGIVVQETKNTFLIITTTNRLITLPKRESIFEFRIGTNLYKIHGCNLLSTTQMRSKQKFKQKKSSLEI